jgi:hypothetical protein
MNIGSRIAGVELTSATALGRTAHVPATLAILLGAAASLARAQSAAPVQVDSAGTIVGIVTMREGGTALPYNVVSAPAVAREQFSNEAGVFTLTGLRPGPLQLRVRHLGFIPADVPVLVRAGRIDTVRIALAHIAVTLATMKVRGYAQCKNPGAPAADADSAFAAVFEQLRQNADQFQLLSRAYPYIYSVERTFSTSHVDGSIRMDNVDTAAFTSADTWSYHPGTVVQREGGLHLLGFGTLMMHIPTLANFADWAFVDNHCFYYSGIETVNGVDLLRIDFIAASHISDPDVDGSMYLDPHNFQIRRSVVRLSRIPRDIAGLRETEAVTYFGEVVTSVPVIAGIMSVNNSSCDRASPTRPPPRTSSNGYWPYTS